MESSVVSLRHQTLAFSTSLPSSFIVQRVLGFSDEADKDCPKVKYCINQLMFFPGSFNSLLRELVAEFTLTDNPANTTTSFLQSLCNQDDGVLLGSWMKVHR